MEGVGNFGDGDNEFDGSRFLIDGVAYDKPADIVSPVLKAFMVADPVAFNMRIRTSVGLNDRVVWLLMFYDRTWFECSLRVLRECEGVSGSVIAEMNRQYDVFRAYPERYKNVPARNHPDIVSEMLGE